jgi:hypothetical protein
MACCLSVRIVGDERLYHRVNDLKKVHHVCVCVCVCVFIVFHHTISTVFLLVVHTHTHTLISLVSDVWFYRGMCVHTHTHTHSKAYSIV